MNLINCNVFHRTLLLGLLLPLQSHALNISDTPLFLADSVKPLVMLDISKDQQLYKKAYNDYSDLDGDGQLETTYKHSINYYGYFDPRKCYDYSSGVFEPASDTTTKYCSGNWSGNFLNWATMTRMDAVRKLLYGGKRSTDTSSNTELERAYLPTDAHAFAKYYNGEYVNGVFVNNISQLTPYNPPATPTAINTSDTNNSEGIGTGLKKFRVGSNTTSFSVGDQVVIKDHSTPGNYMVGAVSCVKGTGINMYNTLAANSNSCSSSDNEIGVVVESTGGTAGGTNKDWDIYNHTQTGITICNATLGSSSGVNSLSQTNTNPPLMRVAQGNFALWAANERWQCLWRDESSSPGESTGSLSNATRTNGNRAALSGLFASSIGPNTSSGNGRINNAPSGYGDFNVRVQACVSNLIGSERCKQYPSGNKPIGLLQVYGDTDQIHFGLMTGSYTKNISGGVLRKNVGTFTNEVNKATDGTFTSTVTSIISPISPSIVGTLDRMRLYGYSYADQGRYNTADSCDWQLTNITEGNCSTWGNPMSEIYYESLRYFAGKTATSNYTYSGTTKDDNLKLPLATWADPLSTTNYCAPLNTLVFNASVSTNDFDLAAISMSDIGSGSTAATLADLVGTGEGIANGSYFVGAFYPSNINELCNAKNGVNLGSIYGICPEGPTLGGSYLMPGMAYHARTNKIRTDLDPVVPATDTKSLKVATYGVQLATNVPQIKVALLNGPTKVIIQPAYRLFNSAPQGGGSLVDMKIVNQTATADTARGQVYLNWEDSEQGGDYDQDIWGMLTYCLTTVTNGCGTDTVANRIYVTTRTIAESTNQPQGFGYVISGTTQDGPHFHSGMDDFDYTDPTNIDVRGGSGHINASGGCNNCAVGDAATTATFTLGSANASTLQDPLYYAAKWGGFNDLGTPPDGLPGAAAEWDALTTTGAPGSDGIPDNYFLVNNPLGLETALNSAFLKILRDSSASAVATNSTKLNTGSRIYQGRFSNSAWSGQLLSYKLDGSGALIGATTAPPAWDTSNTPYPEWDSGQNIKSQAGANSDTRLILTRGSAGTGTDLQYANLSSSQASALNLDRLSRQDNCGLERVAFLRGHSGKEGNGDLTCATAPVTADPVIKPQKFRVRDVSILGDVVNSNPAFVGSPNAGYSDVDHPGYSTFRTTFNNRTPVVYVGANDGMLHGFDVSVVAATNLPDTNAGKEVIAYVPTPVFGNLSRLTDSSYKSMHKYFVDSSPMVADACVSASTGCSNTWKTVLVSGLGAGGKGYFALNVTNPKDSTNNTSATPLFETSNAANIVMWEFTTNEDADDLGYTFNSAPVNPNNGQARQIAKFENGRWGVAVGNGYNSVSGKAVLYVLFLSGPTGSGGVWQGGGIDYMKIEADVGSGNGLSTPTLYDSDGDKLIDTIYAGDLRGNVWKFNLSDSVPANWTKALSGAPLFTTPIDVDGVHQPITSPVAISLHPVNGLMVIFGTGKYLESTDTTSTTQTVYGIHDENVVISGRSQLTPQVFGASTITVDSDRYRESSVGCDADALTPLPDCPASSKGWYADLPITNERIMGAARITSGVALFVSFIPSTSPCDFGGKSWFYALNYETGEALPYAVFDENKDGKVDDEDDPYTGKEIPPTLNPPTIIPGGPVIFSSLDGGIKIFPPVPEGGLRGRITWREIVQ